MCDGNQFTKGENTRSRDYRRFVGKIGGMSFNQLVQWNGIDQLLHGFVGPVNRPTKVMGLVVFEVKKSFRHAARLVHVHLLLQPRRRVSACIFGVWRWQNLTD